MGVMQYYTSSGSTKEDVVQAVTLLSPEDHPFLTMVSKGKARSPVHDWLTDSLSSRSGGTARIEGFAWSAGTHTGRTRITNYTQINDRPISVSGTLIASDQHGVKNEYKHQMKKAAKELGIHIEYALWNNASAVSGETAVAREAKGILGFITSEVATSGADRTLTAALMNGVLQGIWDNGGDPTYIFCGSARKENLVDLITSGYGRRQMEGNPGTIAQYVDFYINDWGKQRVVMSRDIDTGTYAILEMNKWKVAWLRAPFMTKTAKISDSEDSWYIAEWTLESHAELFNGFVQDISG